MTEEEAKKKWCPMVRISGAGSSGAISNRGCTDEGVHDDMAQMCMASDCMAWRWEEQCETCLQAGLKESGYCGLAGKE